MFGIAGEAGGGDGFQGGAGLGVHLAAGEVDPALVLLVAAAGAAGAGFLELHQALPAQPVEHVGDRIPAAHEDPLVGVIVTVALRPRSGMIRRHHSVGYIVPHRHQGHLRQVAVGVVLMASRRDAVRRRADGDAVHGSAALGDGLVGAVAEALELPFASLVLLTL